MKQWVFDCSHLRQIAALLASHGYAALALAYFRYADLPPDMVQIPLEYFESAIQWLHDQEGVNGDCLALMGASRGGEDEADYHADLSLCDGRKHQSQGRRRIVRKLPTAE